MAGKEICSKKDKNPDAPGDELCPGCNCSVTSSANNPCLRCVAKMCKVALCFCCREKCDISIKLVIDETAKERIARMMTDIGELARYASEIDARDNISSTSEHSESLQPANSDASSTVVGTVAVESDTSVALSRRPDELVSMPAAEEQSLCESTAKREDEADPRNLDNVPGDPAPSTSRTRRRNLPLRCAADTDVKIEGGRAFCGGCQCILVGGERCTTCVSGRCDVALCACCCEEACIVTFNDPVTGTSGLFTRRGIGHVEESDAPDKDSKYCERLPHKPADGGASSSEGLVPTGSDAPAIQTCEEPLPLHMPAPEEEQRLRESTCQREAHEDQRNIKHGSTASAQNASETKSEDPPISAAASDENAKKDKSQFCAGCTYEDLNTDDCVACEGIKYEVANCPCCRMQEKYCMGCTCNVVEPPFESCFLCQTKRCEVAKCPCCRDKDSKC